MTVGIYPGCSLKGSSREYKESVFALAKILELDIKEITDWNCCGATAAHNLNKDLSLALPARILALAEKDGIDEILVPCAACYSRLMVTQHALRKEEVRERISGIIEMEYKGTSTIINVVQWIEKYVMPYVEYKMYKPFRYKVACYYGCLLVRPHEILKFDRPEDPQSMDRVMKAIGAETIDWPSKVECCGAGLSIARTDMVAKLSGNIVRDAYQRGAEAIIVACPMCHANLDMRRPEINKFTGLKMDIPVLYISQAVGLALGADDKSVGLQRHFVPVALPETYYEKEEKIVKPLEVEE